MKIKKEINTNNNLSDAADKKRDYNLIIIYKDNKPDIISSLSTDFLFYLKEKGNKFNHFDEVILTHILFNNLNIEDNEFDFVEEEKEGKISQDRKNNEKNTKEIKIKLDNIVNIIIIYFTQLEQKYNLIHILIKKILIEII